MPFVKSKQRKTFIKLLNDIFLSKDMIPSRGIKLRSLHKQVYRHLDYFIRSSLDGDDYFLQDFLSQEPKEHDAYRIEEIRKKLFEKTGFRFNVDTLRKHITKQLKRYGMTPLEELNGGLFRINPDYYEMVVPGPGRGYFLSMKEARRRNKI